MDKAFIPTETMEFSNLHMVIEWFIKLRWIACMGVLFTLIIFSTYLNIHLPYRILFSINFFLISANTAYNLYLVKIKRKVLTNKEKKVFLHIQIISDYTLLILLIYFTGYLENPMIYYLVFHIMLTSFLFPERTLIIYTFATVCMLITISLLQNRMIIPYYPLSISDDFNQYFDRIIFRTGGLASILIITAYLIASIKDRINFKGKMCEVELSHYKSLDKIKSNFILQVTHELRGPLAAVIGYHEILLKGLTGELPEKSITLLTKANKRTDNLLTMIGEMIDFAYMKSEKEVIYEEKKLSLFDLISENISLVRDSAKKKGISFTVNCAKNIELRTNRDLINMILGNLLTNSIKYSHKDGDVSITCSKKKKEVLLIISDQGIGIDENELGEIFEEFYRTRTARSLEKDGTGLGLAIVKRAVKSLNGKVNVYSRKGNGTSFHITLPDKS
ncbi:MAG: HAMP domain-containing histidine kinase [Spirochaetaceae bacterium]|nr:HAMP domain-containing histidine kinase [Spirochaetaceae bacterium]